MQFDQKPVWETATDDQRRSTGPVEIDPADFRWICGGSPRNGWPATDTTTLSVTDPASSPRNGW